MQKYNGPPKEAFEKNKAKYAPQSHSYQHLFVYKALRDLKELFEQDRAMDSVPKNLYYSLVAKLREELLDIEVLIYAAYDTKDCREKLLFLQQSWENTIKIRGRISSLYLKKLITEKKFALYFRTIDPLLRQLKGWRDSVKKTAVGQ